MYGVNTNSVLTSCGNKGNDSMQNAPVRNIYCNATKVASNELLLCLLLHYDETLKTMDLSKGHFIVQSIMARALFLSFGKI